MQLYHDNLGSIQPSDVNLSPFPPAALTVGGAAPARVSGNDHLVASQQLSRDSSASKTDVQTAAVKHVNVTPEMTGKRARIVKDQAGIFQTPDEPPTVSFLQSTCATFTNPPSQKIPRTCLSSSSATTSSSPSEPTLLTEPFEQSSNAVRKNIGVVIDNESVTPAPFECSSPTSDTSSPKIAPEIMTHNYAPANAVNLGLFGRLPPELRDQVYSLFPDDETPQVGSICQPLALRSISKSVCADQHRLPRMCTHTHFNWSNLSTSAPKDHFNIIYRGALGGSNSEAYRHSFPNDVEKNLVLSEKHQDSKLPLWFFCCSMANWFGFGLVIQRPKNAALEAPSDRWATRSRP